MDHMMSVLSSNSQMVCGPETQGWSVWNGYVENLSSPIHLYNSFFNCTIEGQIPTLVYEEVHTSGIGNPRLEPYLLFFDCETGLDDYCSADVWAHFVFGESNQTPDVIP